MIYPTTLPEPLISTGSTQSAPSFKTTRFDYKTRQRAIPRGYVQFSASFVMDSVELVEFLTFYEDAENDTAYVFTADWLVHANDNPTKEIRFTSGSSISAIGNLMYNVGINCEVLSWGNGAVCPLVPSYTLYPREGQYPC